MRAKAEYVGTLNLKQPWYNRIDKDTTFPDLGEGEYWYDHNGFCFEAVRGEQRMLMIPIGTIVEIKIGVFHGTAFSVKKKLRIVWRKGIETVISGFIIEDPESVRQALTTKGWA